MKRCHFILGFLLFLTPSAFGQDARAWVEPGEAASIVQNVQGQADGFPMPVSIVSPGTVPQTVVGKDADAAARSGNSVPIAGEDTGGNIKTFRVGASGIQALGLKSDTPTIVTGDMVMPTSETGTKGGLVVGIYNHDTIGGLWHRSLGDAAGNMFVRQAAPVTAVGPAADGAAVSGNPVRMALKDNGGLTQDVAGSFQGVLASVGQRFVNADDLPNNFAGRLIDKNGDEASQVIYNHVFDGVGWDRQRGTSADGTLMDLGVNNDVIIQPLVSTVDTVGSTDRTDQMLDNVTLVAPQFATIEMNTTDPVTIKTAVVGKKIRVINVVLIASGNVDVTFESNATAITGILDLNTNSGFAPGYDPTGHFQTVANEALVVDTDLAVHIGGWIKFIEVD